MKLAQKSVKKLVGFLVHVETPKFWDFLQKEIFKQIGHHLWTFPIFKRFLKFIFSIIFRILRVQFETLEPKIVADISVIYNSYVIPTKTKKTVPFFVWFWLKFIYSEKATKFCEIFPLLLTVCTVVRSKGKISQNFVAFSEYMNFTYK